METIDPVEHQRFALRLEKLIESVIYLCHHSADDPNFGVTKLVKLLYYADCDAYLKYGEPITGNTYLHLPHGPYPENWYKVRQRMEQAGDVRVVREEAGGYHHRYRLLPNRSLQEEMLSDQEKTILDEQLAKFASFNAAGIEEFAHQGFGWLSTEDGEPIPYELSGITAPRYSANEIAIGKRVGDEYAAWLGGV